MNLLFMCVATSESEQFDNLLSQLKQIDVSVFHASVLLLTMNFIITMSK